MFVILQFFLFNDALVYGNIVINEKKVSNMLTFDMTISSITPIRLQVAVSEKGLYYKFFLNTFKPSDIVEIWHTFY